MLTQPVKNFDNDLKARISTEFKECADFCNVQYENLKLEPDDIGAGEVFLNGRIDEPYALPHFYPDSEKNLKSWIIRFLAKFI